MRIPFKRLIHRDSENGLITFPSISSSTHPQALYFNPCPAGEFGLPLPAAAVLTTAELPGVGLHGVHPLTAPVKSQFDKYIQAVSTQT